MRPARLASRRSRLSVFAAGLFAAVGGFGIDIAEAQDDLLRPGEAFATRFSGTTTAPGPPAVAAAGASITCANHLETLKQIKRLLQLDAMAMNPAL